jgi:hypothetical protein
MLECHFLYAMKILRNERTFYVEEICSQHHTIWSLKWVETHDDVFIISHTMKVRIYCNLMMFVDFENRHFVQFIHERLHLHQIYN